MSTKDRQRSIHHRLLCVVDPYPNFCYISTYKWQYNIHSMSILRYPLCLHVCCVGNLIWTLLGDSTCYECRHTGLLQIRFRWSYAFCRLVTNQNTRKITEMLLHTIWFILRYLLGFSIFYEHARRHAPIFHVTVKKRIWEFVPLNYNK